MMDKIVFATANEGKVKEIKEILADFSIEVVSLKEMNITTEVDENGTTFEENSLIKAKAISKITNMPVVADDSGLCIECLPDELGLHTARFLNHLPMKERCLELIKKVEGDILYIDPPYNSRQYSSNYHILETAALYDYPEVKGKTVQRKDNINKRSTFCIKKKVLDSFDQLLKEAKFKYIILSYSNEGLVSLEEIERIMKKNGKPETFEKYEIPYRRFKSRSTSKEIKLKEIIFFIEKENLCI